MIYRRMTALALFFLVPAVLRAEDPKPTYPPPAEVRAAFHKLLDRPAVPLDVKVEETKTADGLTTEHLSFASEKHADGKVERVPALVVRPEKADKKLPAVIVLHGTGGNKEGQRGWLNDLAKRGFLAVAIDARYHGERAGGAKGAAAYVDAITRAWETKPANRRSIRSTTTPAGTCGRRSITCNSATTWTRSGSALSASAWAASRRGWRRRRTSASRCWSRPSRCRVSAGAWTTTSGRAGPTRSSGAHEAAARDLGEAEGQSEGVPRPVEQGDSGHPGPVRLPEHDPAVRAAADADPQRRTGSE